MLAGRTGPLVRAIAITLRAPSQHGVGATPTARTLPARLAPARVEAERRGGQVPIQRDHPGRKLTPTGVTSAGKPTLPRATLAGRVAECSPAQCVGEHFADVYGGGCAGVGDGDRATGCGAAGDGGESVNVAEVADIFYAAR
jgi:hypothetical protein